MMADFLSNFGQLLSQNIWLAFLTALVAGLVSSFSPCMLSAVPLVIGYVGGYAGNDKKRAFKYSLFFCVGLVTTFTVLGALSAMLGRLMTGTGNWWYIVLGGIMVLVALQMFGIINFMPQSCGVPTPKKGLFGAFLLGIVGGILSSPCATPVLVAILAFVAGQGNIVYGMALLAVYAIGHCALLLVAGTSVGFVQTLAASPDTEKAGKVLKFIFGLLILFLAFYLFGIGFD
ncbi:MAG: Thiol:disulfide interchange protein DsbD precursor [Pelotomaculum sp. PtaB.Bin104]|nr:MAG: Thiol:disulfide interchange protein DsbD precursor [Pelotomaculum sp. PtaB.Bin104]